MYYIWCNIKNEDNIKIHEVIKSGKCNTSFCFIAFYDSKITLNVDIHHIYIPIFIIYVFEYIPIKCEYTNGARTKL